VELSAGFLRPRYGFGGFCGFTGGLRGSFGIAVGWIAAYFIVTLLPKEVMFVLLLT
jgi:hypothetical protein